MIVGCHDRSLNAKTSPLLSHCVNCVNVLFLYPLLKLFVVTLEKCSRLILFLCLITTI